MSVAHTLRLWNCMSVAHSVEVTYNAALNRPSYQSSVYTNAYGRYIASLANDGSRETVVSKDNKPRCTHTLLDTNPWWAVDLGVPTTVYKVDFTNRGDRFGMWLGYFVWASFRCCLILFALFTVNVIDLISFFQTVCCHCGADEFFFEVLISFFYLWIRN